jgi:hypothetical protein
MQAHELAPLNRRGTLAQRERRSNKRLRRAMDWKGRREREKRRARGPLTMVVAHDGKVEEVSLMGYVFAAMGFSSVGRPVSRIGRRGKDAPRAAHPAD